MQRYMIVERFLKGAAPVYHRLRQHGRQLPDGVDFVDSWVTQDLTTCYQVVATCDREKLSPWMDAWRDLVAFEVVPVVSSAEASDIIAACGGTEPIGPATSS